MTRRLIVPPGLTHLYERLHYAPGIVIGDILYASGQVGRDADLNVIADPEAQFEQAFRNVGMVLEAAGATFADVFQLETWFLHYPQDLAIFRKVKDRYFVGDYPTWNSYGVAALSMPGLLVEIKITAQVKGA